MPIKILDVTQADYQASDWKAVETAEQWMLRIPELFITARSRQTIIGISEVGMDCRKCVARKLAEKPRTPDGSWFPFIGTAVHDQLEHGFAERWPDEYHLENRLHVHSYKGLELGGSCDMAAIIEDGKSVIVNDWKVVGQEALNKAAKGDIKNQYRTQAMLYGLGWKKKGYDVSHVSLTFLPRDKDLSNAQVVMLRYDEDLAMESLAKLELLIDAAEIIGWDAVIDKQPKAGFCWDCKKYDQQEDGDISSLI
jgi:hypothetical protein